jgi:hypothetical protein
VSAASVKIFFEVVICDAVRVNASLEVYAFIGCAQKLILTSMNTFLHMLAHESNSTPFACSFGLLKFGIKTYMQREKPK